MKDVFASVKNMLESERIPYPLRNSKASERHLMFDEVRRIVKQSDES